MALHLAGSEGRGRHEGRMGMDVFQLVLYLIFLTLIYPLNSSKTDVVNPEHSNFEIKQDKHDNHDGYPSDVRFG